MNRRKIEIVPFAEHDSVTYYTVQFKGQKSETDLFFEKFDTEKFIEDIDVILSRIDKIGANGAEERYFRYASKMSDGVSELPSHLDKSKLRLYCIRLNKEIVILGNGGEKKTATYNEDPVLNGHVEDLIKVDKWLRQKLRSNAITIYNKQLFQLKEFEI